MPEVNGKKFPYTKKGMKAAAKARKAKKRKMNLRTQEGREMAMNKMMK